MSRFSRPTTLAFLICLLLCGLHDAHAQTIRTGPSAFCHVIDGRFTDCNPGSPGLEE